VDHGSPGQHHNAQQHSIPSVYLHTTPPLSQSKLGHAQQHAPVLPVQQHQQHFPQQAALALQDEPLLKQAKQAYAGAAPQALFRLTYHHYVRLATG